MKRSDLNALKAKPAAGPAVASGLIDNARLVGTTAEMSPQFAEMGYQPDDWKAYVEFDICHALPNSMGPVQLGNYCGFFPDTLAASYGSLLHQQMNLRHLIKAYDKENIPRDRIVGCVVATSFPKAPSGGWKVGDSADAAPCIHAMAVLFKLAEGVNSMLGDHQASRKKQSVSIETITNLGNIGVYRPSTGECFSIFDVPDEWLPAMEIIKDQSLPGIRKLDGEQLLEIYGLDGKPIAFRGTGFTPNPAERAAGIRHINAEHTQMVGVTAETVEQTIVGAELRFFTGRKGIVRRVVTEGTARAPGLVFGIKATRDNPVVDVELPDKRHVLHPLRKVLELVT